TGIAYSDRAPYHRSPDIAPSSVVRGWDFVDNDPYPNDRNGHGTFVASEIAAAANNGYGMVGIAYDAKIMPVRVLDGDGTGTGGRIARGIRWAVNHGAQVINVSIELYDRFTLDPQSMTTNPAIRSAVSYAGAHHVLVVAAAGNAQSALVPSTRLGSDILYVGGSTEHGCLGDYSNYGPGMDIVAPGGGPDAGYRARPRRARPRPPLRQRPARRRGRPRRPALTRSDDQHAAGSVVADLVRHRSKQEPLRAGHALVAEHDQVGALLLGDVEDRVRRVALPDVDLRPQPHRARLARGLLQRGLDVLAL